MGQDQMAACVCNGVVKVDHRPTLGNYVNKHFKKLCRGTGICGSDDERTLTEGFKQLTEVRNRDANFPLVEEAFVPAFDILVKAMRHGEHPPAKF